MAAEHSELNLDVNQLTLSGKQMQRCSVSFFIVSLRAHTRNIYILNYLYNIYFIVIFTTIVIFNTIVIVNTIVIIILQ